MSKPTFGIDLGTTCSTIGLVQGGIPRLICVEEGDVLLPSVVSFPPEGPPIVGRAAVNRLALAPERTIRSSKRDMGTDRRWTVGDEELGPEQVAEHVLRRLCDGVEAAGLARPVRVVLTVPAWFPQPARAATRRAGEAAGLEVVRLINEPTAAALAHAHGQATERRALVYDLGGGTFDVSLVDQNGLLTEVLASHGDTHLGGDDIDAALLDHVIDQIAQGGDDDLALLLEEDPGARERARCAVEAAKIQLSSEAEVVVRAPFIGEIAGVPRHMEVPLSRAVLREVATPLLRRTMLSVRRVLDDAKVSPEDIDELLLVGGMSRTPQVFATLFDELGLEGSSAIAPDRAVGLGAAIQAAILDGSRVDGILVDVAPYSLSVGVATGPLPQLLTNFICRVVTPRNSPLPARHTEVFFTSAPRQQSIAIPVLQGADPDPRRNLVLGRIQMDRLPDAPDHLPHRPIAVEFRHDLDGLVQIEVRDQLSGRAVQARIAADGEDVAELREQLLEDMGDLQPGWGESVEDPPTESRPLAESPPDASPAPAASPEESDAEMERTFARLLADRDSIADLDPEDAASLLRLAREGIAKLATGDHAAAGRCHDDLSDLLFEFGVYL